MSIQLFFKEHPVYFTIIICHFLVGLFTYWTTLLKNEYKRLKKIIAGKHAAKEDTVVIIAELAFTSFLACLAGYLTVPYAIIEHYRTTLPAPPPKEPEATTS